MIKNNTLWLFYSMVLLNNKQNKNVYISDTIVLNILKNVLKTDLFVLASTRLLFLFVWKIQFDAILVLESFMFRDVFNNLKKNTLWNKKTSQPTHGVEGFLPTGFKKIPIQAKHPLGALYFTNELTQYLSIKVFQYVFVYHYLPHQ